MNKMDSVRGEQKEILLELKNSDFNKKKEAVKKTIALMSCGKDVSIIFQGKPLILRRAQMSRIRKHRDEKAGLPIHHKLRPSQTRRCHHVHQFFPQRHQKRLSSYQSFSYPYTGISRGLTIKWISYLTHHRCFKRWRSLCQKNCPLHFIETL
jgi:hypothetical protein